MYSDKVFRIALLVSVAVHGALLTQTPFFNFLPRGENKRQEVKVSYVRNQPPAVMPKVALEKKEPAHRLPSKITLQKVSPPAFVDIGLLSMEKERMSQVGRVAALREIGLPKPSVVKPDTIFVKKKITLPPIDLDKNSSPTYLSYYQIVREKIRRASYQNYTRTEEGEVYLSFVVTSTGALTEVRLVEEKTTPNNYLRDTALISIKDASPFPKFPKELDYPQLSFNVVISFEIE